MNQQKIVDGLKANLKEIYRKALDADTALIALREQNLAQFDSVFSNDSGFGFEADRFMPYVEALALELDKLEQTSDEAWQAELTLLVRKMELLLRTLNQFQQSLKA